MISFDEATKDWREMADFQEPVSNTVRRYPRSLDEAFPVRNDGITFHPAQTTLGDEMVYLVEAVIIVGLIAYLVWGFV